MLGSNEPTDDNPATDAGDTRPGDGSPGGWVPSSISSAAIGAHSHAQWQAANDVHETIRRIRKAAPAGTYTDEWLREHAAETLTSVGPHGKSGALGRLSGHLFERLDLRAYNLRSVDGSRLVQPSDPNNPAIDAFLVDARGKVVGVVQQKCGPSGVGKAVSKLQAHELSSSAKAALRVPSDRLRPCVKAAGGRVTVEASCVSKKTVDRVARKGLQDLAKHGKAATSLGRQAGRAASKSATTSTVIGACVELPALWRKDLNGRQYLARRAMDSVEAGATAAATTAAIAGVASGTAALTSVATAGTVAATVVGTVAASTMVVPAAVGIAVGFGVSRAVKPLRNLATDRLRGDTDDLDSELAAVVLELTPGSEGEGHQPSLDPDGP